MHKHEILASTSIGNIKIALFYSLSDKIPTRIAPKNEEMSNIEAINELSFQRPKSSRQIGSQNKNPQVHPFKQK